MVDTNLKGKCWMVIGIIILIIKVFISPKEIHKLKKKNIIIHELSILGKLQGEISDDNIS